jgi:enamine deaminase RidA (YjgF/YER057c/UK114 family)
VSVDLPPAALGDTKTQTINILSKIRAVLGRRGYALADVVKLTVYLVGDPANGGGMDYAGMNEGYRQFFGTSENPNLAARATVQVVALAEPAFLVEIEATAIRMPAKRRSQRPCRTTEHPSRETLGASYFVSTFSISANVQALSNNALVGP